MSASLVGSRISLISTNDIRYEGILGYVDTENASVTLQNVKLWGTEGRVVGTQVPPEDKLHECISFQGCFIKDLHVHETAEPLPLPPAPPQPEPEAPTSAAVPTPALAPATTTAPVTVVGPGGGKDVAPSRQAPRGEGRKGGYIPPHKNPNWKPPPTIQRAPSGPRCGSAFSGPGALPGTGNHLLSRRTRGKGGGEDPEDREFDFQAALAKFDKEKEMAKLSGGVSAVSLEDPTTESRQWGGDA
ncbi:unnamed protein product, partial [Discosporangium mesarthrocarpum]